MIVLDTNIISEAFRIAPNSTVRSWLDAQKPADLFLCAPVLAELRYGIERLSVGARRTGLEQMISRVESELFESRILPFDREAAYEFGRIQARRVNLGRPISTMDALIAAIAVSNRMAIATRNTGDFAELGLDVINPFAPAAAP
ncbi:MAG TPA: type II toxin-antitoxin system VapC family toxin [Xanthobacteraceae bacterium]|jgi:predicted nucleic acid-binding protein|nr:type II toxin-antitoxin system VapC family toxin [Xanthobacteraceae bacterium]